MGLLFDEKLEAITKSVDKIDPKLERAIQDKANQTFKEMSIVPDDQRPVFTQKLEALKFKDNDERDAFREEVKNEFDFFNADSKRKVIEGMKRDAEGIDPNAFKTENAKKIKKLEIIRNNIIKTKFGNLSPDTKKKVATFVEENKLDKVATRKLVSQVVVMPEDMTSQIISTMTGKRPDQVAALIDGYRDAYNKNELDIKGPFSTEMSVKRAEKIALIEEKVNSLAENGKYSEAIKNIGKDNLIKQIADTQFESGGEGGTLTSLLFSAIDRSSQMGSMYKVAAASFFQKNGENARIMADEAQDLMDKAVSGNAWLSPVNPVDDIKIFEKYLSAPTPNLDQFLKDNPQFKSDQMKNIVLDQSNLPSLQGAALGFALDSSKLQDNFNKIANINLTVDPLKVAKEVAFNGMVTLAGFVSTMTTDPIGLVFGSGAVKAGASGTRIQKLAKEQKAFKSADLAKLATTEQKIVAGVLDDLADVKRFGVTEFKEAENFVDAFEDLTFGAVDPAFRNKDSVQSIVKFRDAQEKISEIKKIRNDLMAMDSKMHSGTMLAADANVMNGQIRGKVKDFERLTGDAGFLMKEPDVVDVLVKDGMQNLSKTGFKELKKLRKGTAVFNEQKALLEETELAAKAIKNPALVDKGGVKILGLEIPGTAATGEAIEKGLKKASFFNRFPGAPKQVVKRINENFRELDGRMQLSANQVDDVLEGLRQEDKIRISVAIDGHKIEKLPDNLRAVAQKVRKGFNDIHHEGKLANDAFVKVLKSRGFSDDAIEKTMREQGGDLVGGYISDYIPQIYRNKKAMKALNENSKKNLPKARAKEKSGIVLSAQDNFSLKREIPNLQEAYKIGVKDPKLLNQIDSAIDEIVQGVRVKQNTKFLTKLGKKGLDPELDLQTLMMARHGSFNKAMARRRMNIDLADDFGIDSTMTQYFDEGKKLDMTDAVDFKGVAMPADVLDAMRELDRPFLKQRLRSEVETGVRFGTTQKLQQIGINRSRTYLAGLEAIDKANNFFKKSVTVVWPKFVSRNMVSNFGMNTLDIGHQAWNPKGILKAGRLVAGQNKKGFGKNMIYKNKFGQVLTGEEMLTAAKENGIFVKLSKVAEASGAKNYGKDFLALTPTGAASQFAEDHARLVNFAANWQRGHTFSESAFRSKKYLIDYGNISRGQREVVNRIIPFYQFFQDNAVNVIETLIKNPMRAILPPKILTEGAQVISGIETKAPPEGTRLFPGQVPAFGPEEVDAEGNRTVKQLTSTSFTTEDLDRYFGIVTDLYQGWILHDKNQKASERSFKNAKQEAMDNLMPIWQAPLVKIDEFLGQQVMKGRKMNPAIGKYMGEMPKVIRDMIGIDFKTDMITGEPLAEVSPMGMIIFKQLGGARALSTAGVLTKDEATLADNITSIFSPLSTRKLDLDKAEQLDKIFKGKDGKASRARLKKAFKKMMEQERNRMMLVK